MNPVHVTALSFESPLGNTWNALTENLRLGHSGIRFLDPGYVPEDFPVRYAAKLPGYEYVAGAPSPVSRAAESLAQAMASRLPPHLKVDGLVCSYREVNGFQIARDIFETSKVQNLEWLDPDRPAQMIRETLARKAQIEIAETTVLNAGCVSSLCALGYAMQRLRQGKWQRALVAAIELDPHPLQLMSFFLHGSMSVGAQDLAEACRPFSRSRNGFVKGEAAALVLLETESAREERKANSFGQLAGYAITSDAYRLTNPRPDGACFQAAMRKALDDARLSPKQIDYIKAHATALPADYIEAEAIRAVFDLPIPVSSLKSLLGNATHAAGLMELICVLVMMREKFAAPNSNLTDPDPLIEALGLNLVGTRAVEQKIEHALLNSSGGGQNASLVIKTAALKP